jgi:hypothetical protein
MMLVVILRGVARSSGRSVDPLAGGAEDYFLFAAAENAHAKVKPAPRQWPDNSFEAGGKADLRSVKRFPL